MICGWRGAAVAVALTLAVGGCGGDDGGDGADGGGGSGGGSSADGLEGDAEALVTCLGEADVEAEAKDVQAFGVEVDHAGVEAADLPGELLKYDTGSGTTSGVSIWVFDDEAAALESRTVITLRDEDDEASWVEGRAVVSWEYPVDREQPQAVAVDECVAELNG